MLPTQVVNRFCSKDFTESGVVLAEDNLEEGARFPLLPLFTRFPVIVAGESLEEDSRRPPIRHCEELDADEEEEEEDNGDGAGPQGDPLDPLEVDSKPGSNGSARAPVAVRPEFR